MASKSLDGPIAKVSAMTNSRRWPPTRLTPSRSRTTAQLMMGFTNSLNRPDVSGRSSCWDQRLGEGWVLTVVDLLDSQSIANAASLRSRSGLYPAVTSSCPATSTPMPLRWSSRGASAVTSGSIRPSSIAISSPRSRIRRARDFSAMRVAVTGSAVFVPSGRQAAQVRISCIRVRLRTWSRSSSGDWFPRLAEDRPALARYRAMRMSHSDFKRREWDPGEGEHASEGDRRPA
jgi:hypothetical protein